jgi:hypothetical protein
MVHSIVQAVLDDFDYDQALEVLEKYGDETVATKVRKMARTSFTESKLERELRRIQDLPDVAAPPSQRSRPAELDAHDVDPAILELQQQRNETVKKRDFIKGQLELLPTNAERLSAALEILSLSDHLMTIWDNINYYKAHGSVPTLDPEDDVTKIFEGVTTVTQLLKIVQNQKTYLSKANTGKRPKEKIPFYEQVIAEGERRINAI